jgi:hypothetical protein
MRAFNDFYSFNEPEPEGVAAKPARYPKPFQPTLWLPGRTGMALQREPRIIVPRTLPFGPAKINSKWLTGLKVCICPSVNNSLALTTLGTSWSTVNLASTNRARISGTSDDAVTRVVTRSGVAIDFGNSSAEYTYALGDLNNNTWTALVWCGVIGNDTEGRQRSFSRTVMTGTGVGARLLCGAGNNLATLQLTSSVTYNSTTYVTAGPNKKEFSFVWQLSEAAGPLTLNSWADGIEYVNVSGSAGNNLSSPSLFSMSSAAITSQMTRYVYLICEWIGRDFTKDELRSLSADPSIIFDQA